ncbi:UbiA prenyltransferase family-domain-containing protein [Amylostereum chailletii]|nr:UbiA prenyltransferase family-domain-containing protein [Amylostereum chailletii]
MESQPLLAGAHDRNPKEKPTLGRYALYYFQLTRLHKFPLGNILVIWPCLWALAMAAYRSGQPPRALATQSALFALGSTLLHSAACVINDICDIDFDRQVERTRHRPLAAGVISVKGAWVLLAVLVAACFGMLALANPTAAFVGIFGVVPFHALYPLMKRWTNWPQAWLGIAMNWGFPVAWLSVLPRSNPADWHEMGVVYVMMVGMLCWTIVYDTEYGCQDRADDVRAGVKSTALLFGAHVRGVLVGFALVFLACLVGAGLLNAHGPAYFAIACGGAAVHFAWQFATWDVDAPADCGAMFKSNGDLGYVVWAGLVLDYALRMRFV